ncbi:MAG: SET domain-containing protein-lysine N-methyltransferase [Candidatus Paceibacterota bacterium]
MQRILKEKKGIYALKVKRASPGSGLGLFAEEDIPKGAYVIEYFGRDVPEKEQYTSKSLYLFEITKKRTIDGTIRENTARYINHSCRPNCEAEIKKGRVLIFAKRNIKKGEELAYDYGKEFFNDHLKSKCKCLKCIEKK